MIENKVKVQKDSVIKEIPENLISDYTFMGWSVVEDKKVEAAEEEEPRFSRRSLRKN
jgi:hypothetical protein